MMKFWILTRPMPDYSNYYGPIPIHTLYPPCRNSFLLRSPLNPRCQLRMNNTKHSRKWGLLIFYMLIPPHRTKYILWILLFLRNLKYWHLSTNSSYTNSFPRICPTLRSNKILRSNCYYKPSFRHPLHRKNPCRMNLRGVCSRQCNPNPIFCPSFLNTLYYCGPCSRTSSIFTSDRLK